MRTIALAMIAAAAGATVGAVPGSAGAVAGSAGPGSLSGGPPIITSTYCAGSGAHDCGEVGYQAQVRTGFRYAHALISIPAHRGSVFDDPALYVGLDHSTSRSWNFVHAGIRPCQPAGLRLLACRHGDTSGWELFAQLSAPGEQTQISAWPVPWSALGKTVSASLYYSQASHTIRARLALAGEPAYMRMFVAPGLHYLRAQALADWTAAISSQRPAPVIGDAPLRVAQFHQARSLP